MTNGWRTPTGFIYVRDEFSKGKETGYKICLVENRPNGSLRITVLDTIRPFGRIDLALSRAEELALQSFQNNE